MDDTRHRWLTLDAMCTTLRLDRKAVLDLANKGHLATIWGTRKDRKITDARFLDPSPAYAHRLTLAEVLHRKANYEAYDLDERALFSLRELAEICGWTKKSAENYIHRKRIKGIRVRAEGISNGVTLYPSTLIRDILWERRERKLASRTAPFLLPELVEWFRKNYADEEALVPTDAQHRFDAAMQKKLALTVGIGAQKDFADKVALARKIVQILESAK